MATSHTDDVVELAHSLTGFQRDLLAALRENGGACYGLAAKRTLEGWYGEEQHHGRLYPNLDTLVNNGLVDKSELDKRTNEYALTDSGEDVLEVLADRYAEGGE